MILSGIFWCIRKGFPLRSLLTCDLCYYKLPGSTMIPHPYGITISNGAEVGEDCCILPNVTVGVKDIQFFFRYGWQPISSVSARIGNRVLIGAGAILLGNIIIADDCIIGAGSVVIDSFLEPGSIIVGTPARRINK